jgi:nicotinamide-nucleotide amidase
MEGLVAYSNEAKVALLGVPRDVLDAHGAVSAPVAEAMASGVRGRAGTTYALSITGVAGPGGGTDEKPIGLVYLGLAAEGAVEHRRLTFGSQPGRAGIRYLAAQAALNLLRLHLLDR